jgi:hypothetical protein
LWYEKNRGYDGTGAPKRFSDFAIITCHEIRQVHRLPLRQTKGFINSLFRIMKIPLVCPDFSCLSKRLGKLGIKVPKYKKTGSPEDGVHAIAIDSTDLKRFGRGEWHQEKYELLNKARLRKLHVAVNQNHYFAACVLTDRLSHDDQQVEPLLEQINDAIDHFSADSTYDETPVYDAVVTHSSAVDVVIPPKSNAVLNDKAARCRMVWQKNRQYRRRNFSELGVQRYQRILGNVMHARVIINQKQEAMIGCGVINKMTSLRMPASYRSA